MSLSMIKRCVWECAEQGKIACLDFRLITGIDDTVTREVRYAGVTIKRANSFGT